MDGEILQRVARAIKAGRKCDAGDVPCPFCNWGPDDLTPQWDETGCIWLAEAAIEAMQEGNVAKALEQDRQ